MVTVRCASPTRNAESFSGTESLQVVLRNFYFHSNTDGGQLVLRSSRVQCALAAAFHHPSLAMNGTRVLAFIVLSLQLTGNEGSEAVCSR